MMFDDLVLFCRSGTTLADIKAAGWEMRSVEPIDAQAALPGTCNWYHRETGRVFMPLWIMEVQLRGEQAGAERVRGLLREAIGIARDDR